MKDNLDCYEEVPISAVPAGSIALGVQANKVKEEDNAIHNWYRFVLSFPPHLAQHYINKFNISEGQHVLDPFSGTGTTLVESQLQNLQTSGIEANPIARFASEVKLSWKINTTDLLDAAYKIVEVTNKKFKRSGIDDANVSVSRDIILKKLPDSAHKLILTDSISPVPLHKVLVLLAEINKSAPDPLKSHLLLAYLKIVVKNASNLRFGPEIGVGKIKTDAEILSVWLHQVEQIQTDLTQIAKDRENKPGIVFLGDARSVDRYILPKSIDAVITSPPYPNEKDYSRTTRLETVLLGLISSNEDLRNIKKTFVRSNTRSVYKEDADDAYVRHFDSIQQIARQIEARRIEMGKNSGFEKMYSKVTLQYFGGMARHLASLRATLKPGAKLAYVVGDQASYLQVMIHTGQLLAEIAESLGYKVINIDLFRTRFATGLRQSLREEVVILEWTGYNAK